jgi:hypothetical protein
LSVLKTGRRLSSTPEDPTRITELKVHTSASTRIPFLFLGLGCAFLLYLSFVSVAHSRLLSLLFLGMSVSFSLYLQGMRYEVSGTRIELKTNWQLFWSESVLGLTRITPDRGVTPFGQRVDGYRLQFLFRSRFVAPLEPEKFIQEIRRVRPELRWWGGELGAEIPGYRLPSLDQSEDLPQTLNQ